MSCSIALTGNPNVGKTSLFNRLTRSFEHVGNWHGVTVKKVSKRIRFNGDEINIDDLPGLYSLSVCSGEEGIARDSLLTGEYDVIVNICEVNNLSRNLYLTMQLLELNLPVVLVVNMIDELKNQEKSLDAKKLEKSLGIPVFPLSTKYKIDSFELIKACTDYAKAFDGNKMVLSYLDRLPITEFIQIIAKKACAAGINSNYAAIKLMENDDFVREKLELSQTENNAIVKFGDLQAKVAAVRYEFIDRISDGVIIRTGKRASIDAGNVATEKKSADNGGKRKSASQLYTQNVEKIDKIALNKYFALPVFFCVMAAIFVVTFGFVGKWLSDGLEWIIDNLIYSPVMHGLEKADVWPWLSALVGDGIINGVGGILVFLPQIVLLFFFLALLEDSGYISRVAFMTDGIFRKIGLSGRSAFTMLMGFGCSATAVLTSRGLEDENMRKKTVLLTPFMSCSARLPVYSAIGGAFFFGANPIVIFFLYFLGAAVAFALAAILEKVKKLRSGRLSFIMEMPPYRFPTFERVRQLIYNNSKVFVVRVGTVIFGLNVIVWLLANFSVYGYTEGTEFMSFLEMFSGFIAPVFRPLGFGNWEAVTSLMSGLIAKESVLAAIESMGGTDIIFTGRHSGLTALCFLVFTLLYVPCIATLGAISKEIGYKWAIFSFGLQMVTAYLITLLVRVIGLFFIYNIGLAIGVLCIAAIGAAVLVALVYSLGHRTCKGCNGCLGGNKNDCEGKTKKNNGV